MTDKHFQVFDRLHFVSVHKFWIVYDDRLFARSPGFINSFSFFLSLNAFAAITSLTQAKSFYRLFIIMLQWGSNVQSSYFSHTT